MMSSQPKWWKSHIACHEHGKDLARGMRAGCTECAEARADLTRHIEYIFSITPPEVFFGTVGSGTCEDQFRYRSGDNVDAVYRPCWVATKS